MPLAAAGDLVDRLHALLGGHADVEAVEAVAHRDADLQVVDAGLDRALGAARIRNEGAVAHAGLALDAGGDRLGIGKLRDHLGMHEAGDLDLLQAGLRQRVDQRDLLLGRDRRCARSADRRACRLR